MRRGLRVFVSGIALAAFTLAGAAVASAQEPAAPAKPVLTLDGDAAVITFLIKPDKTADFEGVVAKLKEASGKSLVIIETVGVGQDEVDIARTADVSIVVLVPGTGDDVQALKAGIMEIADIFVVNKCDRDGADRMVTSIESNLALQAYGEGEWRPPIVKTEATTGHGVAELWATVQQFRTHSEGARPRRLKARNEFRLRDLLTHRFMELVEHDLLGAGEFAALVARIAAREIDPYTAASDILSRALRPRP